MTETTPMTKLLFHEHRITPDGCFDVYSNCGIKGAVIVRESMTDLIDRMVKIGGKKSKRHIRAQVKLIYAALSSNDYCVVAPELPVKDYDTKKTYYVDVALFYKGSYEVGGSLKPYALLEVDDYSHGKSKSINNMKKRDGAIMRMAMAPIVRFDMASLINIRVDHYRTSDDILNYIAHKYVEYHLDQAGYIGRSQRD